LLRTGLATGLTSLAQQIAVTIGIPLFGAVAATRADLLDGVHLALRVQVIAIPLAVALIWIGLRSQVRSGRRRPR
jgi:hypothetical protein